MSFNDVKEQLQEKIFNLGQWLQGVFADELTPFKLHPLRVGSIRLTQFAFHRDQIRQYLSRHCPELDMLVSIEESSGPVD
jgi:hypothetical protein